MMIMIRVMMMVLWLQRFHRGLGVHESSSRRTTASLWSGTVQRGMAAVLCCSMPLRGARCGDRAGSAFRSPPSSPRRTQPPIWSRPAATSSVSTPVTWSDSANRRRCRRSSPALRAVWPFGSLAATEQCFSLRSQQRIKVCLNIDLNCQSSVLLFYSFQGTGANWVTLSFA